MVPIEAMVEAAEAMECSAKPVKAAEMTSAAETTEAMVEAAEVVKSTMMEAAPMPEAVTTSEPGGNEGLAVHGRPGGDRHR